VSSGVRLASAADRTAIATLRRAWVAENEGGPVADDGYEAEFDAWFAREHEQRVTWLALADGKPVGMLNILVFTRMPRPGRLRSQWAYLANFFVLANHRNAGLGDLMLTACLEYGDAHDFVRVVLSPSERSVPLYVRSGFVPADDLLVRRSPGVG
jgi:GNAT superfamily N-acetyltransferase